MKTLSTFNQTSTDSPHAACTRLFEFVIGSQAMYLCSRTFNETTTPNTFNGQIYQPLIIEYDEINMGDIRFDGSTPDPSETSFTIDNTIPINDGISRFSEILRDSPFFYSDVSMYDIMDGATLAADKMLVFKGQIEDIDVSDPEQIKIICSGPDTALLNKFQGDMCDPEVYPGADPDDIGKLLPVVYGSAKNVPFLAVDAGTMTTLATAIDIDDTTLELSDATGFPFGGGTIITDEEEITYTTISGHSLIGCTRAYNGTTAVAHNVGAIVAELQTSYAFIIGHPVRSLDIVYVENKDTGQHIRQDPTKYTAYTGQTGDENPDYPGRACIVFPTLASLARQINIEIVDNIGVDDNIAVPDGGHAHEGEPAYQTWFFDNAVSTNGYHIYMDEQDPNSLGGSNASKLADGNMGTYTGMQYQGNTIAVQKVALENKNGTPDQVRICMLVGFVDGGCGATFTFMGRTVSYSNTGISEYKGVATKSSWYALSAGQKDWDYVQSLTGTVVRTGTNPSGYTFVGEVWAEFIVTSETSTDLADINKTGTVVKTGTVTLTGNSVADTVIGGRVSADVQGWCLTDEVGYKLDATDWDTLATEKYLRTFNREVTKILTTNPANTILYISTDSGLIWSDITPAGIVVDILVTGSNLDFSTIACSGGINSILFVSTNDGASWTSYNLSSSIDITVITAILCCNSGVIIVLGTNSGGATKVYFSSNFGASWSDITPIGITSYVYTHIISDLTGQKLAINDTVNFLISDDGGVNWVVRNPAVSLYPYSGSCDGTGDKIAISANNGLYTTVNRGVTWARNSFFSEFVMVTVSGDGQSIIANISAFTSKNIYVSSNFGGSFEVIHPIDNNTHNWLYGRISYENEFIFAAVYGTPFVFYKGTLDLLGHAYATGALIERPHMICQHFLVNYCGWNVDDVGNTYSYVDEDYIRNGTIISAVLLEKPVPHEFLSYLAYQAKSAQFFDEGKHQMVYLPDYSTVAMTIPENRIDEGSVKVSYSKRADLKNKVSAVYKKSWVEQGNKTDVETMKNMVVGESISSQAKYGILEGDQLFLDFLIGETQTRNFLSWYLGETHEPVITIEFAGGKFFSALQKGDVVNFEFDTGGYLDKLFLGLISSTITKFRITQLFDDSKTLKFLARSETMEVPLLNGEVVIDFSLASVSKGQRGSSNSFVPSTICDGVLSLYTNYISAGTWGEGCILIDSLSLPKDSSILKATLMCSDLSDSMMGGIPTKVYCNDVDDAVMPALNDYTAFDALALTSAYIDWRTPLNVDGITRSVYLPDLSSIIQEVVNRAGWVSGNSLMIIIKIDRDTLATQPTRFAPFEFCTSSSPGKLMVQYQADWVPFFNNTKWESDQLEDSDPIETEWDSVNGRWNFNIHSTADGGKVRALGDWYRGFRPEKMRIFHDHSGTDPKLTVKDINGSTLYLALNYVSGTEILINWDGRSDLYSFQLEVDVADNTLFHVTNVEFFNSGVITQTSTTTTTTCTTTNTTHTGFTYSTSTSTSSSSTTTSSSSTSSSTSTSTTTTTLSTSSTGSTYTTGSTTTTSTTA